MNNEQPDNRELLQIGEISSRAGVTARTVRYYMEEGFIEPADRSAGGFYLFEPRAAETVYFVRKLKDLGLALKDIKALFAVRREKATGDEACRLVEEHLKKERDLLQEKIKAYQHLKNDIEEAITLVASCDGCRKKPDRHNCSTCAVVRSREEVPMAFQAIL